MVKLIVYPPESNCIRGFPTIPVSQEDSIAQESSAVTVLIPEMNFTCNQRILAFYFGGINLQGQQDPMIQIWRENSSIPARTTRSYDTNLAREQFHTRKLLQN